MTRYTTFAISWTAFIIYLSSRPGGSFGGDGSLREQVISNLAHIPEYALLTFLWLKAFVVLQQNGDGITSRRKAAVLAGLVFFAVSDEIHQSFVPDRSASLMDIGLDLTGILAGMWIYKTRVFKAGIALLRKKP